MGSSSSFSFSFCVVLHEFGHALAARRYGIRTRDITLLPIGGLARLERMPDNPREEVVVALAGPAVNIVIAAAVSMDCGLTGGVPWAAMMVHNGTPVALGLFNVNIWLVLFKMIPAFPMDGGRVLRALLAMGMNYVRATELAAKTGQAIAFVFFIIGAWWNPLLLLIAVFVSFGAGSELAFAQMSSISKDLRVSSAMVTQFQSLPLDATLHDAVEALLSTSQHEFPITATDGTVHGILTRDDMIAALRKSGADTPVTEVMRTQIPAVTESMLFEKVFPGMQECRRPALSVLDSNGRLVGLFTPENLGEMIMVQSAIGSRAR